MRVRVQSKRAWALVTGALCAAVVVLGLVSPAGALPPIGGTQATALIFGGAQLQATCPIGTGPVQAGPAGFGAGTISGFGTSLCDANAANATPDQATFANTGIITAGPAAFTTVSATCTKGSAATAGSVDVLSGVVGAPFSSTTTQTVTDTAGNSYILNEVINDGTFVTRNAIRVLTGPNAGAIIGQVICPLAAYPLAVGTASPAAGLLPLGNAADGGSGSATSRLLLAGIAAVLVAQVGLGLWLRRRTAGSAG